MASQAEEVIQDGDHVLTMGDSLTVEAFLRAAARTRSFAITVITAGPHQDVVILSFPLPRVTFQAASQGSGLAQRLRGAKETKALDIQTVSDAATFTSMVLATKVIILFPL